MPRKEFWVPLDQARMRSFVSDGPHGSKMALSVYDIPSHVGISVDEANRCVTVQFKYMVDEPSVVECPVEDVCIELGKQSKRLQRMTVSLPADVWSKLKKSASEASGLPSRSEVPRELKELRFKAINSALQDSRKAIEEMVAQY